MIWEKLYNSYKMLKNYLGKFCNNLTIQKSWIGLENGNPESTKYRRGNKYIFQPQFVLVAKS